MQKKITLPENRASKVGDKVITMVTCYDYTNAKLVDESNVEMLSLIHISGTRASIDEFTQTTRKGLEIIGHADRAKAIIILNPAEPPVMMCNTIYTLVKNPDEKAIIEAVNKRIKEVQQYVPGYQLRVPPIIDGNKVTVIIQVEGAGDFLPKYSGNLDIINSAAIAVAEKLAAKMLNK